MLSSLRTHVLLLLLLAWSGLGFGAQDAAAPAALDQAFTRLQSYDWGQSVQPLKPIEDAVVAAHARPATRDALEKRLTAVLSTTAPRAAKELVCRKLSLVGTGESVPALAPLVLDPELSHIARFALERIPDRRAAEALRRALPEAGGKVQVGIVNSLGVLADRRAAGALIKLLDSPDTSLAGAAASALGKIGTPEAARALEQFRATTPKTLAPLATEACVAAAQDLLRRGARAEAARIFHQLESQDNAESVRLAAWRGLVEVEPKPTVKRLTQALAGEGNCSLAARVITDLPGEHALDPFVAVLPGLPAEGQVTVLDAICHRRDLASRPAVLPMFNSANPSVRLAALRALAVIGNAEDVPRLAACAAVGNGEENVAAIKALAKLPGREASGAILKMLPDAKPPLRSGLIRVLGARGATEAAPVLADQLEDADASVRGAAFEALAVLGDEKQAPAVIACLKRASEDASRREAEKALDALVARAGAPCGPALLSGLTDAGTAPRVILLQQLGRLGGAPALEAVRAALRSGDEPVREAAFRALAGWPDAGAVPDLLELARRAESPPRRALAFGGYVRLCREGRMTTPERLDRLSEAVRLAAGTEEKLLVISALAEVPEPGSLKLVASYLDDAALVDAASVAAVKVAPALGVNHKDAAVPVLQRVLKVCKNADVQKRAREVLTNLGVPSENREMKTSP